jgi:hypothetical protein
VIYIVFDIYIPGGYTDCCMALSVLIPEQAEWTLYARGDVEEYSAAPGKGTWIMFAPGSAVILFYKYSRHRRAYIVRDVTELRHYEAVRLLNVREPVGVLAKLTGRRIDIVRRACFNLERINGFEVYGYSARFWQRFSCLIDNYDGRRTACIKSNLAELSRRYAVRHSMPARGHD